MKEAAPWIFRSLEGHPGELGFDTIVTAAVSAFSPLRRPSEAQARDFGRLVCPLWPRLSLEAKRSLAAALSQAPRMPRELVVQLLAAPLEVAAPFLMSSPVLGASDLAALEARGDERIQRLIERRREHWAPNGVSPEAPAGTLDLPVVNAPALSAAHLTGAESDRVHGEAAQEARETLRRLVRPGRPVARAEVSELLEENRAGNLEAFFHLLAEKLVLSPQQFNTVLEDDTGFALALALKALDAGLADAVEMIMRAHSVVGGSVAAFDAVAVHYAALDAQECAARFRLSAGRLAAGRKSGSADTARPSFGRRAEPPADERRKQSNG